MLWLAAAVLGGNAGGPVSFPITSSLRKGTLFGSFRYGYNDYKTSVAILDKSTLQERSGRLILGS